jgi:hypothetical protein
MATMGHDVAQIRPLLRHLMQRADPIPQFELEVPLSIEAFFREYLVRRGCRKSYLTRCELFETLRGIRALKNPSGLRSALSGIAIERVKEITALSKFTEISETCCTIERITYEISGHLGADRNEFCSSTELLFRLSIYLQYYPTEIGRIVNGRDFSTYLKNLPAFKSDFDAICGILQRAPIPTHSFAMCEIAFGLITRAFDFTVFRKNRTKFGRFDDRACERMTTDGEALINDQMQDFVEKDAWMAERTSELSTRPDILFVMHLAGLESNPLRKVREFDRGLRLIRAFYMEGAPSGVTLGEDQLLPLSLIGLMLANPPFLVSNIAYINEFCQFAFLQSMVVSVSAKLAAIMQLVLGSSAPVI